MPRLASFYDMRGEDDNYIDIPRVPILMDLHPEEVYLSGGGGGAKLFIDGILLYTEPMSSPWW